MIAYIASQSNESLITELSSGNREAGNLLYERHNRFLIGFFNWKVLIFLELMLRISLK